ncbi:hypothetical protein WJX79_004063 [Trebouxia sp. C0005]|nr:MAG: hypothetical protein FRX49_03803 [Trebouxia sp. A1-2]
MQETADKYSVQDAFQGSSVLITGATGYVGSLVLEQLLRVGHISKAYLLVRTKQGEDPQQRLRSLLASPIFRLHDCTQINTKLQIIHGDLSKPGCGISTADETQLKSHVQYVVHSAASIRFDNPVHTDLKLSYMATKALADMATGMQRLRCFMYVSTAYANAHSDLKVAVEQLYPLQDANGVLLDHAAITQHLLSLCPEQAQLEVEKIKQQHNSHQNTYGFCKNLTEQLMGSYHMQPYPVCISRPTGVGAVAKTPCPGYIGNSAAATAMILSIACGLGTVSSMPKGMAQHIVPGDMASSVILASMAATAAGQGCQTSPNITLADGFCSTPLSMGELVSFTCDYFRNDPPSQFQFGDGQYAVRWTTDIKEYDEWCRTEDLRVQQLCEKLREQGLPKAAARESFDCSS